MFTFYFFFLGHFYPLHPLLTHKFWVPPARSVPRLSPAQLARLPAKWPVQVSAQGRRRAEHFKTENVLFLPMCLIQQLIPSICKHINELQEDTILSKNMDFSFFGLPLGAGSFCEKLADFRGCFLFALHHSLKLSLPAIQNL